ncbi:CoA transferase [Dactylosporangium sp. CA-092794]|uniref:CoA transferase n=1 Tax=Dactylosporangium sp. CA-092794 TaxID=3239929 RepID=UPI003D8C187D
MTGFAPLSGLRVVELSSFVAAPLAGLTLSQLGADVIRIDPLGGAADYGRWPLAPSGRSLYWTGLNRGKRSVALDLRSAAGQELATALIADPHPDGGILVTNAAGRDWLDDARLRARRADLIHIRVLGHPDGGSAVDYTVNAALGYPLVTGHPDDPRPVNHVLPAWDLLTGANAALAVIAAERQRRLTGAGECVSISLWDVALTSASVLGMFAEAEVNRTERARYGNRYYGGFGNDFETGDGRVMVVVLSERQWWKLVEVTGAAGEIERLAAEHGVTFAADGERFRRTDEIAAVLAPWFGARSTAAVVAELAAAGVVCSRYRTFREIVEAEAVEWAANPVVAVVDQPDVGRVHATGTPLRSDRHDPPPVPTAHRLGEDTEAVLAERLGLTAAEIGRLGAAGVIAGAAR